MKKPNSRAIAGGYSFGGELVLTVGPVHPELFRRVGSFRSSPFEKDFDDRFGKAWSNPPVIENGYKLIWIGCG